MSARRGRIAIVGAGPVGQGLALLARGRGYEVSCVVSRRRSSARALARLTRTSLYSDSPSEIPEHTDIILVAVPDSELRAVSKSLSKSFRRARKKRWVIHTSGVTPADVLAPLRRLNIGIASIHPIRSFPPGPPPAWKELEGTWFGVETSARERAWALRFVRCLGGRSLIVPKSKKTLYHIACTFASNYALTLLQAVSIIARRAGMKKDLRPFEKLLITSIGRGFRVGPTAALTGPVVRGDRSVLKQHREELRRALPKLLPLFDELVLLTAREAVSGRRLTAKQRRAIRTLFASPS